MFLISSIYVSPLLFSSLFYLSLCPLPFCAFSSSVHPHRSQITSPGLSFPQNTVFSVSCFLHWKCVLYTLSIPYSLVRKLSSLVPRAPMLRWKVGKRQSSVVPSRECKPRRGPGDPDTASGRFWRWGTLADKEREWREQIIALKASATHIHGSLAIARRSRQCQICAL